MKLICALITLLVSMAVVPPCLADTVALKNGDHLTGTITGSDGKELTLKTDYAGEIKIQWAAVTDVTSAGPLYVVTADKKTVNGSISIAGSDLVVHTATEGEVRVPLTQLTIVRSGDQQQAYEKSLHPRLIDAWTGGVNVGFALARGNSDTTNLSTGVNADRKTLSDEIKVNTASIYTTNGATTTAGAPTGVTADAILGAVRYDRNLKQKFFVFASGDFTHDALQDLTLRSIYTGGFGWHAINHPSTSLDLLAGVNYTRETYSSAATVAVPAGTNVGRNLPGLTTGEVFMHKFGASTTFTEDFTFYPDLTDIAQYRFALDSSLVMKISKWFGWQTTFSDRYVTDPPILGTKSNDVILSTGLNIAFSH
jgi:putative salt-induced outer membrane protein YdiY